MDEAEWRRTRCFLEVMDLGHFWRDAKESLRNCFRGAGGAATILIAVGLATELPLQLFQQLWQVRSTIQACCTLC